MPQNPNIREPPRIPLICARCDVAGVTVVRRDNGIPNHPKPMDCIAALKERVMQLEQFAFMVPK